MDKYLNLSCPYCKQQFNEGDDIVVCPDCGTPHHRACYLSHGACAMESYHGEEMKAPEIKHVEKEEADEITCHRCGGKNPADRSFCEHCGSRLEPNSSPWNEFAFFTDIIKKDEVIDGVPAGDIADFVGDNSGYFLPRFKLFSEGRRTDFNWSAFLFSYFYLFYRKMYAYGFFILLASFILSLPSLALYLVDYQSFLISEGLLGEAFFTLADPGTVTKFAGAASVLIWLMRGFVMLCTNRIYYNHVMDKIHRIRENGFEDNMEYSHTLSAKGGTNKTFVIIISAILMLFYTASSLATLFLTMG